MSEAIRYSNYDLIARPYNEECAPELSEKAFLSLKKLLLPHLPEKAQILDLGCGTGQLAQKLLIKGYKVTGIDGSEEMLRYAGENAPGGKFILSDARFFQFPSTFDGVVSTNCVLNYVMNLEELTGVFRNVYYSLLPNGWFVFDLDMEEEYQKFLQGNISGKVTDDYACTAVRSYDPESKVSQVKVTIFNLVDDDNWRRLDHTLLEKCYSRSEIRSALEKVGFTEVSIYDAERHLGRHGEAGSTYFICRKPLKRG